MRSGVEVETRDAEEWLWGIVREEGSGVESWGEFTR
jgi:hypothetical protein